MKKLSALLFALLTAAVPCAALADAPVYSPSPCEPVAAPVCGPVGESVATACPGGVCQINVDVGTACKGGRCEIGVGGASG